ncbi:hypothetical protein [Mesorhizobium sp. M0571]|uniref:hypothetical protein n=1 Tax=Mesorhizobium sp. M0571 TaxID=2956960 RepID=UPI003337BE6C
MGVVQDKVLEVDKFALEPERGSGIGKMLALDKAVADRRTGNPLVEADQNLGRCGFYLRISILRMSYPRWLWVVLRD